MLKGKVTIAMIKEKLNIHVDEGEKEEEAQIDVETPLDKNDALDDLDRKADEIQDEELNEEYDDVPIDENGAYEEESPPKPDDTNDEENDADEEESDEAQYEEEDHQEDYPNARQSPQEYAKDEKDRWFPEEAEEIGLEKPLRRAGALAARAARYEVGKQSD
jgi:hypothetical protein